MRSQVIIISRLLQHIEIKLCFARSPPSENERKRVELKQVYIIIIALCLNFFTRTETGQHYMHGKEYFLILLKPFERCNTLCSCGKTGAQHDKRNKSADSFVNSRRKYNKRPKMSRFVVFRERAYSSHVYHKITKCCHQEHEIDARGTNKHFMGHKSVPKLRLFILEESFLLVSNIFVRRSTGLHCRL